MAHIKEGIVKTQYRRFGWKLDSAYKLFTINVAYMNTQTKEKLVYKLPGVFTSCMQLT